MNTFIHSLMTFIDLMALSSVVGTVLCLHWTMCPVCVGEESLANPCFDRCRRLLLYCLAGLSISSIGILVQRSMEMAGLGITEITPVLPTVLFSSHYGSMWLLRAGSVMVAWGVWWLGRRRLASGLVIAILLSACVAIAFSRSASSHAADYGDLSLQQLSDWFHLIAAVAWGGALISMALMLSVSDVANSAEQQHIVAGMADKFYALFGPLFAVLAAFGLYNSWVEVRSFSALLTTTYGLFLSAKLLIFAYLTSRYIAPPQRGKDEAAYAIKFVRRTRVEALLILAILLSVSLFTHEIPARHAAHMMMQHEHKMDSNPEKSPDHDMSHKMEQSHGMKHGSGM